MGLADAHEIGNSIFKTKTGLSSKHQCVRESSVDPLVGTRVSVRQKSKLAAVESTC